MTFRNERRYNSAARDRSRVARSSRPQRLLGGAAFACVVFASVWTLYVNIAGDGADQVDVVGTRGDKLVTAKPSAPVPSDSYAFLFDPRSSLGFPPGTFSRSAPVQVGRQAAAPPAPQPAIQETQDVASTPPTGDRIAQSAAMPVPQLRLSQIPNASPRVGTETHHAVANASADQPFFEKLFGKPAFEKLFGKPANLTLAYAAPDDGGVLGGQSLASGRYDQWTAVYDISAHKVYMPDGTQLEAHSGLGSRLDDPRYAAEKDYGVTPPNVYDLEPREALFHGVRALRLIPEDEGKVFGRTGLLAHSFMLGPNGDSNGCVSFRNYDAFLQAYDNQQIKRLVVVTRLD
jgi:hypothetical protein